jgi:predicted CoA-binding protein
MNSAIKKTVVLGASDSPMRYSYLAVRRLKSYDHPVVAIGKKKGVIDDTEIITEHPAIDNVDTVTIYLNPIHQQQYYEYILSLHPKRIIFNPGAENAELANLAKENNIQPVDACTLVMLGTGQY